MINAELGHVKTLKQFHKEIRAAQEEAHGDFYCAQHDALIKYMEDCDSYMELGTHQGGTASAAMLCKPSKIVLVDNDMHRYEKFLKPLAETFCKRKKIDLTVKEIDSTSPKSTAKVDMLLIDSYHHPAHMNRELMMHQVNIKKYIIAHDTSILHGKPNSSLYETLELFCKTYPWEIIERGMKNVGYTVLKRL